MPKPPRAPARRLTPERARQIVGEWITFRRLNPRQPGEPTPPQVTAAYRCFARDRDRHQTAADHRHTAAAMRRARIKQGYGSVTDRLKRFDRDLIPSGGRLSVQIVRTRRKLKASWPVVTLQLPAAHPGYFLRFKATSRGHFYALSRLTTGRTPAGMPKPFHWTPVPFALLPSLHPAAQSFLAALRPLPAP